MESRELDVVRHVLTGGSVVDWRRLDFNSREDVDAHLRLNKLDWHDPRDRRYMRRVWGDAVHFLEGTLERKLSEEVARAEDIRDIFLLARRESTRRVRMDACFTLKVMNIINHVNGREILFRAAISQRDLTFMAHKPTGMAICRELIARETGVRWSTQTTIGRIDPEAARLMADSGCVQIGFGVESGSQLIIEANNKNVHVKKAERQSVFDVVLSVCRDDVGLPNPIDRSIFLIEMNGHDAHDRNRTLRYLKRGRLTGFVIDVEDRAFDASEKARHDDRKIAERRGDRK